MGNKLNQFLSIIIMSIMAGIISITMVISLSMVMACSMSTPQYGNKNQTIEGTKSDTSGVSAAIPSGKNTMVSGKKKQAIVKSSGLSPATPLSSRQTLANPAATRCINDGYLLEPIMENGVPKGYMCVNPRTGTKCEIWNYFHKKCRLN